MRLAIHVCVVSLGICINAYFVSGKLPLEINSSVHSVLKTRIRHYLGEYVTAQEKLPTAKQMNGVLELVKELISLTDETIVDGDDYLHPVTMYRFVRNHTVIYNYTISRLQDILQQNKHDTFDMAIFDEIKVFPTFEEYAYVTKAILNLQEVYNISANNASTSGLFKHKLAAQECRDFSQIAFITNRTYLSRQWGMEGLRLMMEENDTTDILEQALDDAALFAFVRGNLHEALNITQFTMEKFPDNEKAGSMFSQISMSMGLVYESMTDERKAETDRIGHQPPPLPTHEQHKHNLCQQSVITTQEENLYCRYEFFSGESWTPLLLEVLSTNPSIVLVHKALSKQTIDVIMHTAKPKVIDQCGLPWKEPQTLGHALEGMQIRNRNVSLSQHDLPGPVWRGIESLFGLKIDSPLKVSSYAIGSDVEHSGEDTQMLNEVAGRSIVKVVMYLMSPEVGGATIFPSANITIYPETGSLLIWPEVADKELTGDLTDAPLTNSECPVMMGEKWTATYRTFV